MLVNKSTLLSLDAFSKTQEDVRIRTKTGAIISISCILVTVLLLLNEWIQYSQIVTRPTLVVDRERNLKLDLNLDISFPSMPCDILNLDILDDAGDLQLDILNQGQFTKTRLDRMGNVIEVSKFKIDDDVAEFPPNDENYCGPCYGSIDQSGNDKIESVKDKICCQTCEQVREAYLKAGWAFFDGKNIEQCEREGYVTKINKHLNEGCRVKGNVLLNRIQGNIHFAPGKAFQNVKGHFHDSSLYETSPDLNFNHIIHHLSFGKTIEQLAQLRGATVATSPLDGQQISPSFDSHLYRYSYFVKIVPTRYEYLDKMISETAQFSATFHQSLVTGERDPENPNIKYSRTGLPGLFIYFEMSPLKIINTEQHFKSWSGVFLHCITSIGGILAVGTILDKFFYKAQRTVINRKSTN
ncbi:endoplasmic reticulum-Golgi intermediate compartment family protein NDAI_0A08710 [Naumovozyma dairenensis CBS 421]|uniref:Endoplasmic reticulum-Golgi intermediate compartment protein n=1 Tax=Naumovozyma dairenensis (strain ATCC 10597 / BCRC 20456 / CBS 421 / NBRC 0211 / NRRL Y-12639) TaxID=1071378 RepID=G0W5D6_NAUDC|nr:hypothetical protein NDAI_0A08710 [Naumovozyma dairenensis CBS 421]CCD23024.1 hypothetical protein NDAI_0A08710 [Naumovozyma dairenensis CBS 421]